ncbi:tRNA uracil 4-sulfurtransferase ThiI [Slackia heliotrinireducens]|uniref:tRNA uracil 4-sulfurtransferase ThiI n=1 Tax=Slackia heliotrinireducens TaxID=84110 RepID=UPI0033155AD5
MTSYQRICLVHYHELGLKGRNRNTFERHLMRNVEALLEHEPVEKVTRISGRVLVLLSAQADLQAGQRAVNILRKVPGVARVSCGYRCEREMDQINDAAHKALSEVDGFYTWKVVARRNHTDFPIDSMELNRLVGAYLCDRFPEKKVQMKGADVEVHVEVVQGYAYVYALTIPGIGGLPIGTAGKVVCLLSSGIDSPVATWRMARRGATCIGVHFSGRPQTQSTSEFLVDDIAHVFEEFGGIARIFTVPFGDHQRKIAALVPPALRIIIYRRFMMRVAERIARDEGAKALVTGESLGQVASQTLDNINCTNAVVKMPVLRPLIGSDKLEIIADAKKIGTYDISSSPAPDCCTLFMPRSPETHAKLADVEAAEAELPVDEWVSELMSKVELREYRCPSSYDSNHHGRAEVKAAVDDNVTKLN